MKTKRCGNCMHAMESEFPQAVYCIAHPPTVHAAMNGFQSRFPMTALNAKCDEFAAGKLQKAGDM